MILVVGATGVVGGNVARRLLSEGHPVRVLVRPGTDLDELTAAGAEPAVGDLKDPASLAKACAGVDSVVTTANSAARGGADTTDSVDRRGNVALVDAARVAGVDHFVFVSAIGADELSPVDFLSAKGQTEAHLKASGMRHTIIRPDVFMEVWFGMMIAMPLQQGRPITLIEPARARHTFVSANDVAALVAEAVMRPAGASRTLQVGGPEALNWRDVVAIAERVLGRSIEVDYVAPGTSLDGLPDVVSHLAAGLEMFETVIDMTDIAAAFGVRLTSAAECLEGMLRPLTSSAS